MGHGWPTFLRSKAMYEVKSYDTVHGFEESGDPICSESFFETEDEATDFFEKEQESNTVLAVEIVHPIGEITHWER
jgi:hypothetical protein